MEETRFNEADQISLKDIFLKIKRWRLFLISKWKIILIFGIIGALAGLLYAWFSKPVYKAELTFALQDDKSSGGLGSALGIASQFGIDLGGSGAGGEFSGDNLVELMKSRSMFEKALLVTVKIKGRVTTLAEYYIDLNKFRADWNDKSGLKDIHFVPDAERKNFTLKQDSLLGAFYRILLKKNVTVDKLDKKLSIIDVKVASTDELFSKYFAEVLTKVVSDFYIQEKTEKAQKNVSILQHQTDSVRAILNGDISGVAASADVNPNPNPFLATLRVPSQQKQVKVAANTTILTQLVANLEIAKMTLLQATPLIQIIDTPILPLDKEKSGKLTTLILGGFLGAFITIVILSIMKLYRNILS